MLFALFCCAVMAPLAFVQKPKRDDDTLRAFLDAIATARLSLTDVYTALGMSQSQFSKIVRGEPGHYLPNMERLAEALPYAVWAEFLPRLSAIVLRRHMQQSAAVIAERKSA